jgi:16S rRNA (guanine527-N7)-methyltransferase
LEIVTKYFTDFTPTQSQQFNALAGLYAEWNAKINVISRKDLEQFYLHHVLHSLTIAANFEFTENMQVIDLGCGGGFPGVPLAIFYPQTQFLLVDSVGKKLTVVNEVCKAIGLTNVTTLHSRVEGIKNQKFDCVISRAVAPLKDLWFWSKPILQKNKKESGIPNGLVCLKGGDLTQEIFESNTKPHVWAVSSFFNEPYFAEKSILYVPYL